LLSKTRTTVANILLRNDDISAVRSRYSQSTGRVWIDVEVWKGGLEGPRGAPQIPPLRRELRFLVQ
jgi:hypothetical protein